MSQNSDTPDTALVPLEGELSETPPGQDVRAPRIPPGSALESSRHVSSWRRKVGRPKGTLGIKHRATIQKEAARDALRQIILRNAEDLVSAQIDNAKGIAHFFLRDKASGQFKRVTDPDEIAAALNAPEAEQNKSFWIYVKDPSVQAFTDLMNRALDKPKEQEAEVKHTGGIVIRHEMGERD